MDNIDMKLLSLLRQNARMSVANLSSELKISRGTVTNRLAKLERNRIIEGYTVKISRDNQAPDITAWTCILVEGNQTRSVAKALLGLPEIRAVHDTNGQWDLLAELCASDTVQLSQVLEKLRGLKGVKRSETSIHLTTFK